MILDLDVGNTWVKWRHGASSGQLLTKDLCQRSYLGTCAAQAPERVRLATVACEQQQTSIEQWSRDGWGVAAEIAMTQSHGGGVTNSYQQPSRMGVDRWLAMMAAYNQAATSCCVVDCGSAITVDYVGADGVHQGGFIIPGLRLMRLGLLANTTRVLTPDAIEVSQSVVPGKSTEEAVDHGISLLFESLAQRIVAEYRQILSSEAKLLITGGDGERFLDVVNEGEFHSQLVLDGLAYALP
ncbi:MAG: type III pantothenate kinase [Motiliproteus sp.]